MNGVRVLSLAISGPSVIGGYAGDYVQGKWLMGQHGIAGDVVLASGETHSIEKSLDIAFAPEIGIDD